MNEFLKGIVLKVRKFFETAEWVWNFLVVPLVGLFLWVSLVTSFTKFSATDALLVVLAFSIWYCVYRIVGALSTIELYLARIVIQQAPGATRLEVITTKEGARGTVLSSGEVPTIADPRGPKR